MSSAFPLVNHPAFGALYTAGAGRPEFGGLGSLGMSTALAAHPQLGALSGKMGTFEFHLALGLMGLHFESSPLSQQSGGELLKPMDGELLRFCLPSLASLLSSLLTFSPTTALVLSRLGCQARTVMPQLKVQHCSSYTLGASCCSAALGDEAFHCVLHEASPHV